MAVIPPVMAAIGLVTSVASLAQGSKAASEQEKAQRVQWQTELETHQFNLDLAKEGLKGGLADISREGARFQRQQGAAMGASGATLGVGTPLMNMISTAAGIEQDKTRLTRSAELEIEFRQGEIDKLNERLNPKKHKRPTTGGSGIDTGRSKPKAPVASGWGW